MPRSKVTESTNRRESASGFHFINLYQNCPRKFFIKYITRVVPIFTGDALINGGAIHEGIATYLNTRSIKKAKRTASAMVEDQASLFEYDEDYMRVSQRAPILLEKWCEILGSSYLEGYKLFASEEELRIRVSGITNYIFTVRPDAILEDDRGRLYILEFKTSSSSWKMAELGVRYGDQATAYIWAAEKQYKRKIYGVIPNVLYWNKQANSESNIEIIECDLVMRSKRETKDFEDGITSLTYEISQKVEAFYSGKYRAGSLFPRNTFYCNSFFKPCEYADICRHNIPLKGRAPRGFKRDRRRANKRLDALTED